MNSSYFERLLYLFAFLIAWDSLHKFLTTLPTIHSKYVLLAPTILLSLHHFVAMNLLGFMLILVSLAMQPLNWRSV